MGWVTNYNVALARLSIFLFVICIVTAKPVLSAEDYTQNLNDFINADMKLWANNDIMIDFLKKKNAEMQDVSESNLMVLDNDWRSEFRKMNQPIIGQVMNNDLAQFLKNKISDAMGVYTELTVINNKGLNIAQTSLSEHYWNAGMPRWDKTFRQNSYATYISDMYYSDETGKFQIEVAFMVIADDQPIGVLAAGIDVEQLEDWKKRRK